MQPKLQDEYTHHQWLNGEKDRKWSNVKSNILWKNVALPDKKFVNEESDGDCTLLFMYFFMLNNSHVTVMTAVHT